MMVFMPFPGDQPVSELVYGPAVFTGAGQRAMTAIIGIAHDRGEKEHARHPCPNSPPTGRQPGEPTPVNVGEEDVREIVPDVFHRTRAPITFMGIVNEANVAEAGHKLVVIRGGELSVGFLLGLDGKITSQPTEAWSIRVSRFIRLGVMYPVRNHTALLSQTDRVCPSINPRE